MGELMSSDMSVGMSYYNDVMPTHVDAVPFILRLLKSHGSSRTERHRMSCVNSLTVWDGAAKWSAACN
jgi:hypothetical protein